MSQGGVPRITVASLETEVADLRAQLDATRAEAAAEQARLTYELGHRVKNTLSVVQALAGQTMRGAATKEEALDTFGRRVMALSRANDVILAQSWTTATLRSVAESVLVPLDAAGSRLSITGPELRLPAGAALSLGMALNELATNAQRFGSWSLPGGRIDLAWRAPDGAAGFEMTWRESGGPAVAAPARKGFGLKLIEQSLKSAFGPDVLMAFQPSGFECRVTAPASALEA